MTARHIIGGSILAIWVCMLGLHARREYFQPAAVRMAAGARMLAPDAHWYVVRLDDVAIGIAQSSLDTVPDGFAFRDEVTLDVPALGSMQRALTRTTIELDAALDIRAFRFVLESAVGRFTLDAQVGSDSAVALTVDAGGGPQQSMLHAVDGLLLDAALALRMAASGALRVGNTFTARVFDPSSMAERDVHVRVTERRLITVPDSARYVGGRWEPTLIDTVPAFRVEQRYGGVTVVSWMDEDGQLVRAESPLGFTIERTDYELARQAWRGTAADARLAAGFGALIEGTALASNVDLADIDVRPRLAVRLHGVDLAGFDLGGGRQQLRGDTLHIVREQPAALVSYPLPYTGGGAPAAELGATPLIQSDDPRIRAAAQAAAAGATAAADVARRLNEWVYGALRKDVTLSVPSALQVLDARRGDCNEHTVLYVALARALGLPARTAVGLVHVRGRFYYHAWPEVWLGAWVAVDPTLGQYPADAGHLRFLVGGLARQVELIRLIGRLQLEVL